VSTQLQLNNNNNNNNNNNTAYKLLKYSLKSWRIAREFWPFSMPGLCELYPGICLTTEEKSRKNLK
jgi:hypothetical protein